MPPTKFSPSPLPRSSHNVYMRMCVHVCVCVCVCVCMFVCGYNKHPYALEALGVDWNCAYSSRHLIPHLPLPSGSIKMHWQLGAPPSPSVVISDQYSCEFVPAAHFHTTTYTYAAASHSSFYLYQIEKKCFNVAYPVGWVQ